MLTNQLALPSLPEGDLTDSATRQQAQVEATVAHRIEDKKIAIAINYNIKLSSVCDSNL